MDKKLKFTLFAAAVLLVTNLITGGFLIAANTQLRQAKEQQVNSLAKAEYSFRLAKTETAFSEAGSETAFDTALAFLISSHEYIKTNWGEKGDTTPDRLQSALLALLSADGDTKSDCNALLISITTALQRQDNARVRADLDILDNRILKRN